MEQNDKYKSWDSYIAHLMMCQFSALSRFKNFVLIEIDSKDIYDLLFYKVISYAEKITENKVKVYCYPPNFFKFLAFKWKEKTARYPGFKLRRHLNAPDTHICTQTERAQLIEEIAKAHHMDLSELKQLYKEYYMVCK